MHIKIETEVYNYCFLCHVCINLPHPTLMVKTYACSSVIKGHLVYKETWLPHIGEQLTMDMEEDNLYDQHAVSILKNKEAVGLMPYMIARSTACTIAWFGFLRSHRLLLPLA